MHPRIMGRAVLAVVLAAGVQAHAVSLGPGDARILLSELGARAEISFVVGQDVAGATRIDLVGAPSAEGFKAGSLQAGLDFVIVGPVLVARPKWLAPHRGRPHDRRLVEVGPVTLDFAAGLPQRDAFRAVAALMGRSIRIHHRVRGWLTGRLIGVDGRVALDALCQAAGLGWGLAHRALVVAPTRDLEEYVREMRVDHWRN